jgi:hypothetical protein
MRPGGTEPQARMTRDGIVRRIVGGSSPENAAEVFETARMHRVALEIEEQVGGIGRRQSIEAEAGIGGEHLVHGRARRGALPLQLGLLGQSRQCLRRDPADFHGVEACQAGEGRNAALVQAPHLPLGDAGDAAQMVGFLPACLAGSGPAALAAITARLRCEIALQFGRECFEEASGAGHNSGRQRAGRSRSGRMPADRRYRASGHPARPAAPARRPAGRHRARSAARVPAGRCARALHPTARRTRASAARPRRRGRGSRRSRATPRRSGPPGRSAGRRAPWLRPSWRSGPPGRRRESRRRHRDHGKGPRDKRPRARFPCG